METINLGKVAFAYKGDYNPATTYASKDVVFDGESSYISKSDGNVGNALSNTDFWGYLAKGNANLSEQNAEDIDTLRADLNEIETDLNEININVNYNNRTIAIPSENKRYSKFDSGFISGKNYLIEIVVSKSFSSTLQSSTDALSSTILDTISTTKAFVAGNTYYFNYSPTGNCRYLYLSGDGVTESNLSSIYVYTNKNKLEALESDVLSIKNDIHNIQADVLEVNATLDGGEYLIWSISSVLHSGWGKYAFLLPNSHWLGKTIKVYCAEIPDGTYDFSTVIGVISVTASEKLQVTFSGGYAIINGVGYHSLSNITHLRIGLVTWNTITANSELSVIGYKVGLNTQVDDISLKTNTLEKVTNPLNWNSVLYYQMMWSTLNCTPIMLKNHPWKHPTEWNFNICINTDSHFHTPDIFSRINRWYQCYNGDQTSISEALTYTQDVFTSEDNSQVAISLYWSLGDLGSAYIITKANVIQHWANIWAVIDDIGNTQRPQLITIGNHDISQDGTDVSQYFTKADRYNYIIKQMLTRFSSNHTHLDTENKFGDWNKIPIIVPNVDYPTMFMVDYEEEKVRIISLDAYDWDDSESSVDCRSQNYGYFSEAQIDWLISCLSNVPVGYAVFLGSHHSYLNQTTFGGNGIIVKNIMLAYRNSTTYEGVLYRVDNKSVIKTVYVDFTGNVTVKALWIIGHDHNFSATPYSNPAIGPKTLPHITAISADGQGGIYRGIYRDMFDIICYNDIDGIRVARYGGVGSKYDVNLNDGGDINGFHFVDNPMSII